MKAGDCVSADHAFITGFSGAPIFREQLSRPSTAATMPSS